MGLDASVHCDCFERGQLKSAPRKEWQVSVESDGSRDTSAIDLEVQLQFDRWNFDEACEHESGVYVHHYLGNVARVAALRAALGASGRAFPIILEDVIYDGIHCGDSVAVEKLDALQAETTYLSRVHGRDANEEQLVRYFERQMRELVDAAIRLRKPIVF